MAAGLPLFSISLLKPKINRVTAINDRSDLVVMDYYDQIAAGGYGKPERVVVGAYLWRAGTPITARIRLPRNFSPSTIDDAGKTIYGQYERYEAACWSDGKLQRWGIPRGYREALAIGRDRKGRLLAVAWRETPEFGDDDAFLWDGKQLRLFRAEVGNGDGSYSNRKIEFWDWEADTMVRLPAPAGYGYGYARQGRHATEYVGGVSTTRTASPATGPVDV